MESVDEAVKHTFVCDGPPNVGGTHSLNQHPLNEAIPSQTPSSLQSRRENTEERLVVMTSTRGDKGPHSVRVYEIDHLTKKEEAYHHDRSAPQSEFVHPTEARTSTNAKDFDVPTEEARIRKGQQETTSTLAVTDGIPSDIQPKVFSTNEPTQQPITPLDLHKNQSGEALDTSNKDHYDRSHERLMHVISIKTEEMNTRDEPLLQIPGEHNPSPEDTDASSMSKDSLPQTISITEYNKHSAVYKESDQNDCTLEIKTSAVQEHDAEEMVHAVIPTEGQRVQSVILMDGAAQSSLQPEITDEHEQFSMPTSIQPPDTFLLDTSVPIKPVEEADKPTPNCGMQKVEEGVILLLHSQQWTTVSSGPTSVIKHLMQDPSLPILMKPVEEESIHSPACDGPEYIHPTIEATLSKTPPEVHSVEENTIDEKLDVIEPTGENKDDDTDAGRPAEREEVKLREESYLQPELIHPPEANKQINIDPPLNSSVNLLLLLKVTFTYHCKYAPFYIYIYILLYRWTKRIVLLLIDWKKRKRLLLPQLLLMISYRISNQSNLRGRC